MEKYKSTVDAWFEEELNEARKVMKREAGIDFDSITPQSVIERFQADLNAWFFDTYTGVLASKIYPIDINKTKQYYVEKFNMFFAEMAAGKYADDKCDE